MVSSIVKNILKSFFMYNLNYKRQLKNIKNNN